MFERKLAFFEILADTAVEAGIASFLHGWQFALFEDGSCIEQGACHSVHTADVCNEEVFEVGRVTTNLRIEVGTAVAQSAVADNFEHGLCQVEVVDGELVGIPSVLSIATVGIDRTQHTGIDGTCQLVFEGMTGKGGVVHFDVHLEVLVQAVSFEESDNRLGIDIILVLAGLHGFRFDEERSFEALGTCIVACHGEHGCHVFLLALLVGIEQTHIAFASTPENVVLSTEFNGGIDGVLDLHDSTGNNVEVGIGRGSVHVTLVAEDIGCSPEILDVGILLHLLQRIVGDSFHASFVFSDGSPLFNEVNIVEAEVLDAQLVHDFEACIHLVLGALNGIVGLVPFVAAGLSAKGVTRSLSQRVPPCHSELQPVFHLLAHYHALRLIVVERHYILTVLSFERNLTGKRKIFFHCYHAPLLSPKKGQPIQGRGLIVIDCFLMSLFRDDGISELVRPFRPGFPSNGHKPPSTHLAVRCWVLHGQSVPTKRKPHRNCCRCQHQDRHPWQHLLRHRSYRLR